MLIVRYERTSDRQLAHALELWHFFRQSEAPRTNTHVTNAIKSSFMTQPQPLPEPHDRSARDGSTAKAWRSIWERMTSVERRAATTAYLVASKSVPMAAASANAVLARELRTRSPTVARWSLDRRADRLARLARWDPPLLAAVVAAFHVECRRHLVITFLDAVQIVHDQGVLGRDALGVEVHRERLAIALDVVRPQFGDRDVELYLDALEAQQIPCLSALPAARARPDSPNSVAEADR